MYICKNLTDMDLHKLDRSEFLYDPLDEDLLAKLSKFSEFKVTISGISKRNIVQYIILMYDKNNGEVRAAYPFYPQRKLEIAKAVGLVSGKKASTKVENILVGKNEDVNRMIIRYLTLFNNPDLLLLASYYEIYIKLNLRSYSGDFESKTITDLERVHNSINELTESVFGGKDETELRQELYKSIEEQSLGIRPEEIAEALKNDKNPVRGYSPYSGEYLPEELKYLGDS